MIRRMLWRVALGCLALTTGTYASSQVEQARTSSTPLTKQGLAAQVSAEVLNGEFVTKIELGNAQRSFPSALEPAKPTWSLVDTELQPDGRVRLTPLFWPTSGDRMLTPDYKDFPGPTNSPPNRLYTIVEGTRVRVTKIQTKDDRLELELTTVPGNAYGKLRLMLGKDYEKKYDADGILTLAGIALKIEWVERRLTLAYVFVEWQRLIASARAAMSASTTPDDRFKRAGTLKALLQEAIRNRAEMESVTKRPAPEMESLRTDLADTERTVAVLALEARFVELQQRIASARAAMSTSTTAADRLKQAGELKTLLQEAIRNRAEMESASKQPAPEMESLKVDLADTESKIAVLPAEATAERVTNARALLASVVAEAEQLRSRATPPGKTMAEWEARRNAVTRWIANAEKRQALLKTLADLGSAGLTEEAAAAEDLRVAQTLLTSLDQEKTEVQLRDLRATYQGMAQKRTQLLDAYTRAYGTEGQREAAQQLVVHLVRMHENRTAAAALGDAAATAEAAALQREIEKLRRQANLGASEVKDLASSTGGAGLDRRRFCGVWEYEQEGRTLYLRISEGASGDFIFRRGYWYQGAIFWADAGIKNASGIHLQFSEGQLKGEFVSWNFLPTHGQDFAYRITLRMKSEDRLDYALWSSIRGETDTREARRVTGR